VTDSQPLGRFAWERIVKRVKMPRATKLTALTLATFSDRDGSNVRPGEEQLAADLDMSTRQVRRHVTRLRDEYGLIDRVQRGGSRSKYPDVYRLVLPDDLADRVEFTDDPELRREKGSRRLEPVDEAVDNGSGDDLRGSDLRTSGAGTPDISCPNSGHINVRPPYRPPTDQDTSISPYGAEVEVRSAGAQDETDLDREYSTAFKVIQRLGGAVARYVEAVHADAERNGHDPPEGRRLTIAVAALALIDHPDLLKPGRRTA
jgi:hypothetical protein